MPCALQQVGRSDAGKLQQLRQCRSRPAESTSSRPRLTRTGAVEPRVQTGVARLPSNRMRSTCAPVITVRFFRLSHRAQEGAYGVEQRKPALLVHLEIGRAEIVAGVEIVDLRHAEFFRRLPHRVEDRPGQPLRARPAIPPPWPWKLLRSGRWWSSDLRNSGSTSSQPQPALPSCRQ